MQAFPTLLIDANGFHARGSFAENQARYLRPDQNVVADLDEALARTNTGVVAHFYMDAELQGVLYECRKAPIQISDSLVMADRAVEMAKRGAKHIVVLGVDFMAENVRAMLDEAGFPDVDVLRVADESIGCSLAEAAESDAYFAYLKNASKSAPALHVIYINTSLYTKATAQIQLPTLTCTSSNVVRTVLQAFAEIPDLQLYFGPDSYMGANLQMMFERYAKMPASEVSKLHPDHTPESLTALLPRFHYFRQGNCIVHHMFGERVVQAVKEQHPDAHIAAHLEVPGEMFALAADAAMQGRGVAGSTSDILKYIVQRVEASPARGRVSVILGTEAGMVTAIVREVKALLAQSEHCQKSVEIVFPVAADAIAATDEQSLPIVPGVAGGEGCSTAGGCATCPYMKMNSLDALSDLVARLGEADRGDLHAFRPRAYSERLEGRSVAAWGGEPILHMRAFQHSGRLAPELVQRLRG